MPVSGHNILTDSLHVRMTAAALRADTRAIGALARETVATSRTWRQVVLLRRAVEKRMADLAAERSSRESTE